jgi:hypothetical protein
MGPSNRALYAEVIEAERLVSEVRTSLLILQRSRRGGQG